MMFGVEGLEPLDRRMVGQDAGSLRWCAPAARAITGECPGVLSSYLAWLPVRGNIVSY
jgi:hypothetical protein